MGFTYEYERPSLTADMVLIDEQDRVLLVRRAGDPFAGRLAIPGGFVEPGENARQGAVRELGEETGLWIDPAAVTEIGAFTDPGRDPRGWVISVAFAARVSSDLGAKAVADVQETLGLDWHPITQLGQLAFDHDRILAAALAADRDGRLAQARPLALAAT